MMTTIPAILKYLSNNQDYTIDQNMDVPHRAKKRRLDHLSWEEKMQRKKLKNRVAAQTSRDRKKAKMDQMEKALQQLFSQNENLLAECESLKLANQRLTQENSELCSRLQQTSCPNCAQSRPVVCEALNGSAVSLLLQKGRATHSAAALDIQATTATVTLKLILTCLLCLTYSTNSTLMSTLTLWNNLLRAYWRTSLEIWKMQLRRLKIRNQLLICKPVTEKWWGPHQRSWNPMDVKC